MSNEAAIDPKYCAFLRENGYDYIIPIGDGKWAAIFEFAFTGAIIVGHLSDYSGYSDRWCYEDTAAAKAALIEWSAANFDNEPQGWHRHPTTGRRRIHGDATTEYINQ